jgi:hypothetical protein
MQETPKKKKRKENLSPSCKSGKALTFKVEKTLTACRQPVFSRLEELVGLKLWCLKRAARGMSSHRGMLHRGSLVIKCSFNSEDDLLLEY